MDFNHRPHDPNETVAAIATPPGEGAIAVIRISGSNAFDIGRKIFSGPIDTYKSHSAHYGKILDEDGETVDCVLLLIMKGPKSYTGEDTIEIHCHGGAAVTKRVLKRVLQAGARAAEPGEFSMRAFMNGKLDLTQAEAVQRLIAAQNDLALNAARNQLEGALSKKVGVLQKQLTEIAAILEAWVDFPEEGLEFASMEEITCSLEAVCKEMSSLTETFHEGKTIHHGLSLCLMGTPNVGKSSLMNALLGKDRAIVTEIAGTTRDTLEDHLTLQGLHFRLIDTAGIRKTDEQIEQEGIRRSHAAVKDADLVLLLLDSTRILTPEDRELLALVPKEKTILIWNKIDLKEPSEIVDWPQVVPLSAKEKQGFKKLYQAIDSLIWKNGPPSKQEIVITEMRHFQALKQAAEAVLKTISGLKEKASPEFVAFDLRQALNELGTIIGTNVTEDILSAIFSKFCLGK